MTAVLVEVGTPPVQLLALNQLVLVVLFHVLVAADTSAANSNAHTTMPADMNIEMWNCINQN
ncbi:MAG TPA: hypothetical protein VHU23_16515 [Rhizomicrobium sp.]|nr:hypothetical protein [Rhizomicrobium sp.]